MYPERITPTSGSHLMPVQWKVDIENTAFRSDMRRAIQLVFYIDRRKKMTETSETDNINNLFTK